MPSTAGMVLNLPDMVLGLVLVVGLFLGLFVGLFRQAIVLVVSYVSVLIASRFFLDLGEAIPLSISPSLVVRSAVAEALLFVILAIFLSWLTHYIPNPIEETGKLVFLGGRAAAAAVGVLWGFLIVAVTVTVLVLALGGNWGVERESDRVALNRALRQSSIVQILSTTVWPISEESQDLLPFGPFLPG